jgi:hypothetical protein
MPIAPEDLLVLDAAAPLPDFEPEAPAPEAVPVGLADPVAEDVAEPNYVIEKLA